MEEDAAILNKNARNCIKTQEVNWDNNKEVLEEEFYSKCNINFNSTGNSWFIQIKDEKNEILNLGKGDEAQCALSEKNPKYMRCVDSTLKMKIKEREYNFIISTGSNQLSREKLT